jgi:hypothetical protein
MPWSLQKAVILRCTEILIGIFHHRPNHLLTIRHLF